MPTTQSHTPAHGHTRPARSSDSLLGDIVKFILAVILPPLGVFLEVGLTKHFWINIVLTLLGYIPGIIHAAYIIATR